MAPAFKAANGYPKRSGERRQGALIGRLAGFEALDRAREDVGCGRKLVDAVAAPDTKTHDTREQWLGQRDAAVSA
jgi:hypothetical protein